MMQLEQEREKANFLLVNEYVVCHTVRNNKIM